MTIREARFSAAQDLSFSSSPALDADCILCFVLNYERTQLLAHGTEILTAEQEAQFLSLVNRRKTGFPIAYITGHKEFYGLNFLVTPDVLIPKPDTELLVELSVNVLLEKISARKDSLLTLCDMCAGSGCVGLSILRTLLASGIPTAQLPKCTFVDISEKALRIAQKNAESLLTPMQLLRCRFIRSNLFETVGGTFDVVASNPPYVPRKETEELLADGRNEPALALNGDVTETGEPSKTNDGLALIKRLIPQTYNQLAPKGIFLMESGEYNAEKAAEVMTNSGFQSVRIERDLSGSLRDVCGVR